MTVEQIQTLFRPVRPWSSPDDANQFGGLERISDAALGALRPAVLDRDRGPLSAALRLGLAEQAWLVASVRIVACSCCWWRFVLE